MGVVCGRNIAPSPEPETIMPKKRRMSLPWTKGTGCVAFRMIDPDQDPEIDVDETLEKHGYLLGDTLGKGAFAQVREVEIEPNCCFSNEFDQSRDQPQPMAMKIVNMNQNVLEAEQFRKFFHRELEIIRSMKHENIVRVWQVIYLSDHYICIAMERMRGGTLHALILNPNVKLTANYSRSIFCQVLSALEYMHGKHIAHRDLKCENVLLEGCMEKAKLSDFGFSRIFDKSRDELSDTYCGSLPYVAPELLKREPYDPMKTDIWSLGVILYRMLTLEFPYKHQGGRGKVLKAQLGKKLNLGTLMIPALCKELLADILNVDTEKRATLDDIKSHHWLAFSTC